MPTWIFCALSNNEVKLHF